MAAALSFMLRPLCFSIPTTHTKLSFLHNALSNSSSLKSNSLAALNFSISIHNLSLQGQEIKKDEEGIDGVAEFSVRYGDDDVRDSGSVDTPVGGSGDPADKPEAKKPSNVPNLTVKEKKELASYAHGLGKKLKSQLVGKSGITPGVISSFIETLEANELLKIKIHRTCPGELEDVVKHLEDSTASVVVGQIGRTVIMYRPSITKMKAEEKRKQARAVFLRRKTKATTLLSRKEHVPRLYGRGQQRTSRV